MADQLTLRWKDEPDLAGGRSVIQGPYMCQKEAGERTEKMAV